MNVNNKYIPDLICFIHRKENKVRNKSDKRDYQKIHNPFFLIKVRSTSRLTV